MIQIALNGATAEIPANTTLLALLARLDIDPAVGGIAIAVNAAVVPRSQWQHTTLQAHDEVELVRATAGG